MQHAVANTLGKIWAFMDSIVNVTVIKDEEQQLTLRLENNKAGVSVVVTLMYAKCN